MTHRLLRSTRLMGTLIGSTSCISIASCEAQSLGDSPVTNSAPTKPSPLTNAAVVNEEEEQCPFCLHFLKSPCSNFFKGWQACVDDAKAKEEDFVEICKEYSKDLFACVENHPQYFTSQSSDDDSDDDEEEKNLTISDPMENGDVKMESADGASK